MNCPANPKLCIFLYVLLTFFSASLEAQDYKFEWVNTFPSTSYYGSNGVSMVIDSNRSIIVTGTFDGTVDFDPGPSIYNLTAATNGQVITGNNDIYIAEYDSSGRFHWAKQIGGPGSSMVFNMRMDPMGNLFIAGFSNAGDDLDPGPGIVPAEPGQNVFILKLDNNGNFIWTKRIVINRFHQILDVDTEGNLILAGSFVGTCDFDPGSGVYNVTSHTATAEDMFVLKLDNDGNFIWMRQIANQGLSSHTVSSLRTDSKGNVFMGGWFTETLDFDPASGKGMVSSTGDNDGFIVKFNDNGNFVWAQHTGNELFNFMRDIRIDNKGNVYSTGFFLGTVDFDPGARVYTLTNTHDDVNCYVLKLDTDGNFLWAKSFDGNLSDGNSLAFDANNNVYIAGGFSDVVDFDPGPGVYNLVSGELFTVKLDEIGNFIWAAGYSNSGKWSSVGAGSGELAVDILKNVYFTSSFTGIIDFDPNRPVHNVSNDDGSYNMFLHKLSQCKNSLKVLNVESCSGYSLNNTTYDKTGTYFQTVNNAIGCDSVIQLNLTIRQPYGIEAITTCNAYNWQGKLLSESGTYRDTIALANGCDSIAELNLTITSTFVRASITSCKPYRWNENILSSSGVYRDTIKTLNGCDSIVELTFTLSKLAAQSVATSCDAYPWNGRMLINSGIYRDTFHTTGGCDSIAELNLTIYDKPRPELGVDSTICEGKEIALSPGLFNSYVWNNEATSSTLIVKNAGTYWVKVTDRNGCSAYDTVKVTHAATCMPVIDPFPIGIPNAFTPNSDGLNDFFKPSFTIPVSKYQMQVFDRWGRNLFTSNDVRKGWDGKVKTVLQNTGTFIYRIVYWYNGLPYSHRGTFVLLR